MASIDTGSGAGDKRAVNFELPLIPFIDFLLCLVSFLLITAVWSQMARINADARVPGPDTGEPPPERPKELHVEMRGERQFQLVWKEGSTVINTIDVARKAVPFGDRDDVQYPELATTIDAEWKHNGAHRGATDKRFDRAVIHVDNTTPFQDLVAVIDAINTPKREYQIGGASETVPAFMVTFAAN
ncbi:MAG: biopolymer transporter ExbD [Polyangiaceae bacterium]|nr:biopolymer transporter ExbD [Polyangiaceae bacterium]